MIQLQNLFFLFNALPQGWWHLCGREPYNSFHCPASPRRKHTSAWHFDALTSSNTSSPGCMSLSHKFLNKKRPHGDQTERFSEEVRVAGCTPGWTSGLVPTCNWGKISQPVLLIPNKLVTSILKHNCQTAISQSSFVVTCWIWFAHLHASAGWAEKAGWQTGSLPRLYALPVTAHWKRRLPPRVPRL